MALLPFFYLGEIATSRAELEVHVSDKTSIFYKNVDSIEIGAKADILKLLAYVGSGSLYRRSHDH
jgi:hypothetical protein